MKTAKVRTQPEDNFREMAIAALESSEDNNQAIDKMVRKIMSDKALLDRNFQAILHRFADYHVRLVGADRRKERPNLMQGTVVAIDGSQFNEAVLANFDRYMSRPVWGGKTIANCTISDLRTSADRYDKQAASMTREARWELAVAAALEKNAVGTEATVRESLPESTLAKLWEEINGD